MKKTLGIALIFVVSLTFGFSQVYACGAENTAAKSTSAKSASYGSSVEAKLISADSKTKACPSMAAAYCSPEECAEMKKICESYDGTCEVRTISVKGMTCESCENAVKDGLRTIDGVVKVAKVSYQKGIALVCVDPTKVKDEAITTAVSNKGFEAQIIPAVAKINDQTGKAASAPGSCCAKKNNTSAKACTGSSK